MLTQFYSVRVLIVKGYDLDSQGSIPGNGKRFVVPPQRQNHLWGPFSFLSNGHMELFPRSKEAGAWSSPLTSSQIKKSGAIIRLPYTSPSSSV
jgi:hypothetical protein